MARAGDGDGGLTATVAATSPAMTTMKETDGDSNGNGYGDGDGDGSGDGDGDVVAKMKAYEAAAIWCSSFLMHHGSKNSSLDPRNINGRIPKEPT